MIARACTAFALSVMLMTAAQGDTVPEPDGYRGEPYNAPVPATLAGATVIDAAQAIRLHADGVGFIDAFPRKPKPDNLPAGTLWHQKPHLSVPGAIWLWNTGYQDLAPAEQARLESGLAQATRDDKTAPVVIYCKADCWMSWNAARRAVAMGYGAVNWFPGGVDDWQAQGGAALVTVEPVAP